MLANLKDISSQRIIFEILDATTVVAPAKNVILPWTFGTSVGITSAKLRDLICPVSIKSPPLLKTLWFSEMTTQRQEKFAQL